jgi:hypothetical protein
LRSIGHVGGGGAGAAEVTERKQSEKRSRKAACFMAASAWRSLDNLCERLREKGNNYKKKKKKNYGRGETDVIMDW